MHRAQAFFQKSPEQQHGELEKRVAEGDAEAQFSMAVQYMLGEGSVCVCASHGTVSLVLFHSIIVIELMLELYVRLYYTWESVCRPQSG